MKRSTVLVLSMLPSLALSAPAINSVSGDSIDDGKQITIHGSGFGSSGPNIILFDDFSNSPAGSVHPEKATVGAWNKSQCITYTDKALSHGQGIRCIDSQGQLTSVVAFPVTQEVFISSTVYIPPNYKFPSASSPKTFPDRSALKHFWLLHSASGYKKSTEPDIAIPTYTGAKFYRVASNDGGGLSTFDTGKDVGWAWDIPMRWTFWAKGNGTSASGTNGMFQSISKTGGHISKSYENYKAWFNSTHSVKGWDRINIIGYARSGASFNDGHNWVIDDVYVATGPNAAARVEIGNAATYSACTNLALSTPVKWSNTSITTTVRQGRFTNIEDAYLYVVDANGVVNTNGFPLKSGNFSSKTLLPPPNLRLINDTGSN